MTERERRLTRDGASQEISSEATPSRGDQVTEKIDDLLEEIDLLMEENAEEFVRNYVQKGGE